MSFDYQISQKEEEILLKDSTQSDKILYILKKHGTIRHNQIDTINKELPGIIRKSTRTLYKIYNSLIKYGNITKIKEIGNNQQYFAYSLTSKGNAYVIKKLKDIPKIEGIKKKKIKVIQSSLDETISQLEQKNSSNPKKETQLLTKTEFDLKSQEESKNNHQIFQKLTNILEKIDRKLESPVPTQSDNINLHNIEDKTNRKATQKTIEDTIKNKIVDSQLSSQSSSNDNTEIIMNDEFEKSLEAFDDSDGNEQYIDESQRQQEILFRSLETRSNNELMSLLNNNSENQEINDTIINKILFQRSHPIEEKIRLYIELTKYSKRIQEVPDNLSEILIHNLKIGEEDLQKFISILSLDPREEEEDAIWQIINPTSLKDETKMSIFLQLLSSSKIMNYIKIQKFIRILQLKAGTIMHILEQKEEYKIRDEISLTILEIVSHQLIVKRSIPWEDTLDFSFQNKALTKKQLVVYYIEQSFLAGLYGRTLQVIDQLKLQNEFSLSEAQIELLILLNLKKYDILEKRIQDYEILTNKTGLYEYQEELNFIAFRTYYEQKGTVENKEKLKQIAINPNFDKKWKSIAKLEYELTQEDAIWNDENDIKVILARLSPLYNEHFRLFPGRSIISFFFEHLVEENVLFYFVPHFTNWLIHQGPQGIKDAVNILKFWWENRFQVVQFLNLQEEILILLKEWDIDNREYWNKELSEIQDIRYFMLQNAN